MCNQRLKRNEQMNHDATARDLAGPSSHTRKDSLVRLTDEQVIALLEEYCTRNSGGAGEFDSAVVELELEAVRRNLDIRAVLERTPPALALERCRYWMRRGHVDAAVRCMWDVSALGAWRLYVDILRIEVSDARLFLLHALLRVIETVQYGEYAARQRDEFLSESKLEYEEMETFLRSCLAAHFDDWMMYRRRL